MDPGDAPYQWGRVLIDLAPMVRDRATVLREVGALVAQGVPWDAAWSLPEGDVDSFLAGVAAARRTTRE